MKSTAIANSNIAFIKYWGRKNEELRLPTNGSVSMTLSDLTTTTTVEFSNKFVEDYVEIDGKVDEKDTKRIIKHIDRIRKLAELNQKTKIISKNNFPSSTGLSSSASGFAALTVAATNAAGLNLSKKELSILSRQGSGSSCRSIHGGFVEWLDGDSSDESYSEQIHDENHWDLYDIIAVVSKEKKEVPTSIGQTYANTSPFFKTRKNYMKERIELCKKYIEEKDFTKFGELIEHEAPDMHAIMISSIPSLIYWTPESLKIMKLVKKWRNEGLQVYFTVNTGQDVHVICEKENKEKLIEKLNNLDFVKEIRQNHAGQGARLIEEHLF